MVIPEMRSDGFRIVPAEKLPLTEKCRHYTSMHEVPWDIQKYFSQRYSLFSWYDEGVYLTDDAWFGVTPEPVANAIASDMGGMDASKTVIIDAFAGAGGNAIAFALSGRWQRVIAIELDAATLACAQNNALVYGVDPDIITWVHADSFAFLSILFNAPQQVHPTLRLNAAATVVFASPPWGGPGYRSDEIFNLKTMQPYTLTQLLGAYAPMDHALYLPRTSDIRQIARYAPEGQKIPVVQYCMHGASKAMVAFFSGKITQRAQTAQNAELSHPAPGLHAAIPRPDSSSSDAAPSEEDCTEKKQQ